MKANNKEARDMQLSELMAGIDARVVSGNTATDIRALAYDAEAASAGSCFFALRGTRHDGHDFATRAVERGAVAVVGERPLTLPEGIASIVVPDSRRALGLAAATLTGDPSSSMLMIGVTGTSGKTTTTYLVESILAAAGRKSGVVGTVEYRYAGRTLPAPHTTPFSLDLQHLLAQMREAGCDACAMEVSSHALLQERVAGCRFDVGLFTNLTPEHLDYHGDMQSYLDAKALLFERVLKEGGKPSARAVINVDDASGAELVRRSLVPVTRFWIRVAGCRGQGHARRIRRPRASDAGCVSARDL